MIANLILLVLILLILIVFYLFHRNNKVYYFIVSLSGVLFDELTRILNTYKDDNEFYKDENNYNYIKEKVYTLSDKHPYYKYLFSFKPLKLKNWFTKEEIEFMIYLRQYRNEMSNM